MNEKEYLIFQLDLGDSGVAAEIELRDRAVIQILAARAGRKKPFGDLTDAVAFAYDLANEFIWIRHCLEFLAKETLKDKAITDFAPDGHLVPNSDGNVRYEE